MLLKYKKGISFLAKKTTPVQIMILSFIAIILFGTFLLMLPFSRQPGMPALSFLDFFFSSASAVCVTGLLIVNTVDYWSIFGQIVLLVLIQVGGIGMITITGFIASAIGKKMGFKSRIILQNTLNQNSMGDIISITKTAIKGTLLFESIGAIILTIYFIAHKNFSILKSIYFGIYHSISAFCNSGYDILGTNSLMNYTDDIVINVVFMSLITLGGIGFFVWQDLFCKLKNKRHRLRVTTRLAVYTSIILTVIGAVCFFISEYSNTLTIGNLSLSNKILASFFQSVTMRTAGFYTVDQFAIRGGSKLLSYILAIIGGSPGGMSGGIKTVTVAVIFCSVWSIIRGREGIQVMRKTISLKTLQKALAVVTIMITVLVTSTAILLITDFNLIKTFGFYEIFHECFNALSTIGITAGITPFLSNFGKITIAITMLIGRIGPVAVLYTLTKPNNNNYLKYPETDVLIG